MKGGVGLFDFSEYVGPLLVGAVMLFSLLSFAIWGSRAIRESADEVLRAREEAAKAAEAANNAGNTEDAENVNVTDGEESDVDVLPWINGGVNAIVASDGDSDGNSDGNSDEDEEPDDIKIYGGFAQTFVNGEEVGQPQPDYTEAISRIKADLDAEAARTEAEIAAKASEAENNAVNGVNGAVGDGDALEADAAEDGTEGGSTRFFTAIEAAELRAAGADNGADGVESDEGDVENPVDGVDENAVGSETDKPVENGVEDAVEDTVEDTMIITDLTDAHEVSGGGINGEPGRAAAASVEVRQNNDTPMRFDKRLDARIDGAMAEAAQTDNLMPESPLPFGGKIAWLAIPGYKPSEVIAALRLAEIEPANWTAGLTQAYSTDDKVFVSPVLDGWVLVIGKTLWRKADMNRSAENIGWLKTVGQMFGNACFFSSMKGLGNHGWVGIRDGAIVRAYGYSGELQELIWLVGEPTEEEIAVNPGFATEMQERNQADFRPVIPDEKMVLELAARWSVDPTFAGKKYPADYGFLGRVE